MVKLQRVRNQLVSIIYFGLEKDVDSMTADEILEVAKQTQGKSIDSLDRTLATIEDSKNVSRLNLND